jgi:hypothetical protein
MNIRINVLAALLLCLAIGCREASNEKLSRSEAPETGMSDLKKDYESDAGYGNNQNGSNQTDSTAKQAAPPDTRQKKQPTGTEPLPNPDWDKKIIKNAFLNFEVKDYKTYYAAFREKIRGLGGYVAQEEQTQSDYKIENTLVIKVPVDQFDNALAQLTAGSEKINERKITSQDVTSEYVDTRSRIEAKKQVRLRYMDLLNQAKNMEEILNVQSEINGIQEEIESATGRVEFLGHSSAYSTINLTYYQVLNSAAKDEENKTPVFGTRVATAFKTGWGWIVDLFVGLVSIWPLFLLVFVVYVIYKRTQPFKSKQA